MNLKDFIDETICAIVDATLELQEKYDDTEVLINPPVSTKDRGLYEDKSPDYTFRRVENVEFDVAVTATSDSAAGGKAGLKIMSFEAGLEGKHTISSANVSRVKFTVPITLSPSRAEETNKKTPKRQTSGKVEVRI